MMLQNFRKKTIQPMRPYIAGESLMGVSVSAEDVPEVGGMVAINPSNPSDQWYIAKKFFEDNYEEINRIETKDAGAPVLTFGEAIQLSKLGHKIARAGWNGKNMFVVYQKGYPEGIPCNANTAEAFGLNEGDLFKCRPYLQMMCADGSAQMWLASQSDILEEDWMVV